MIVLSGKEEHEGDRQPLQEDLSRFLSQLHNDCRPWPGGCWN